MLCHDANNPDSCEYILQDSELGNMCDAIEDKNGESGVFLKFINVEPKCPVKPVSQQSRIIGVLQPKVAIYGIM